MPWHARHTCVLCQFLGRDLIAHRFNRFRIGPNKRDPEFLKFLGECTVFAQKTITGMHGIGFGRFNGVNNLIHHQIRLRRLRRSNMHGLIRHRHMQRILIRIRINRHSLDAHKAGGLNHATSNFPAVRYQYFFDHAFTISYRLFFNPSLLRCWLKNLKIHIFLLSSLERDLETETSKSVR